MDFKKKKKWRSLNVDEQDLLNLFKSWIRQINPQLDRMRQLSYTQEEINDMWKKFYKEICRKSFLEFRIIKKYSEVELIENLKLDKYNTFWHKLHEENVNMYGIASLIIK